jgi:hypothetical protein
MVRAQSASLRRITTTTFELQAEHIPATRQWIRRVQKFFANVTAANDAGGGSGGSKNGGGGGGVPDDDELLDVIESVCLEYAVKLTPNLGTLPSCVFLLFLFCVI